jgi:hypothetical protein
VIVKLTYTINPNYLNVNPSLVQAYEIWIQKELGEALRMAKMATGG